MGMAVSVQHSERSGHRHASQRRRPEEEQEDKQVFKTCKNPVIKNPFHEGLVHADIK